MDTKTIADRLRGLIQQDINATRAYSRVIDRLDAGLVRDRLAQFKGDHERHIRELTEHLRRLGHQPPRRNPNAMGLVLGLYTEVRSAMGRRGALQALHTDEIVSYTSYDAAKWDLPDDIKDTVLRGLEDERRHLAYVREQIEGGRTPLPTAAE